MMKDFSGGGAVDVRDIINRAEAQQRAMQTRLDNQQAAISNLLSIVMQHKPLPDAMELVVMETTTDHRTFRIKGAHIDGTLLVIDIKQIGQ